MLSQSPPSKGSRPSDSEDDLFKPTRRVKKPLHFLNNHKSSSTKKPAPSNCFSSKSLDLNLSLSAKKVETIGVGSLNSSQQVFRNNLIENNSSHVMKHFEDLNQKTPEEVMTSRVMVRDQDKLVHNIRDVVKPSSFSAQKGVCRANGLLDSTLYDFAKKEATQEVTDSGIHVATPDSEFLLNSEVVDVNEFRASSQKHVDVDVNKNDRFEHKRTKNFRDKLSPLNLARLGANPFCLDDPKTERSEYTSDHSAKKLKLENIQNSMKNKNFIMSAGNGSLSQLTQSNLQKQSKTTPT